MRREIEVREEPAKPLSDREKKQLAELERQIVKDFGAFFRVGQALVEISEKKLYRETHKTFETYCKDLWDMGRSNAYRLIDSAEVYDNLKICCEEKMSPNWGQNNDNIIDLLPINEAQVRPLVRLQPDQQREVWQAVIDNAGPQCKVTASLVNTVVKKYLGETVKKNLRTAREHVAAELHVSAEFGQAFRVFLEQLEKERDAGYKKTSRLMIVKHLDQLRHIIAEDGAKIKEPGFTIGNANKLETAGYLLFRPNKLSLSIEIRSGGGWPKYSGPYLTKTAMNMAFAELMQDKNHLRG